MSNFPKAISLDDPELIERIKRRDEELKRQCFIRNGSIVFDVIGEYEIDLSRCSTSHAILHWVDHLIPKTWMTKDLAKRFIHLAASHHGINIYHP